MLDFEIIHKYFYDNFKVDTVKNRSNMMYSNDMVGYVTHNIICVDNKRVCVLDYWYYPTSAEYLTNIKSIPISTIYRINSIKNILT